MTRPAFYRKLTTRRRENLAKLATYLEGLPKRYRHFDMSLFASGFTDEERYALKNGGVEAYVENKEYACGTIACAVGHGPAAGILMAKSMIGRWGDVDWSAYSAAKFVGAYVPDYDDSVKYPDPHLFSWMFGGDWSDVDNHHYGAAARIRYLLADRPLPDDLLCFKQTEADSWVPRPKHRKLYQEFRK